MQPCHWSICCILPRGQSWNTFSLAQGIPLLPKLVYLVLRLQFCWKKSKWSCAHGKVDQVQKGDKIFVAANPSPFPTLICPLPGPISTVFLPLPALFWSPLQKDWVDIAIRTRATRHFSLMDAYLQVVLTAIRMVFKTQGTKRKCDEKPRIGWDGPVTISVGRIIAWVARWIDWAICGIQDTTTL